MIISSSVTDVPEIINLSPEHTVLFFGQLRGRYFIVFGPARECLPESEGHKELWSAKLAFGGLGEEMTVCDIKHGHKYAKGGGFVETREGRSIYFRPAGHEKPSTYQDEQDCFYAVPMDKVYTCL